MGVFELIAVWLSSIVSGGLLTIGIAEMATGQAVIKVTRRSWSAAENRKSGACTVIQGAVLAVYIIVSALVFGAHVIPEFWLGHWWGIFATASFAVVILGTVAFQAYLELRHENRLRTRHP